MLSLLSNIFPLLGKVIDKAVPDKNLRMQIKADLQQQLLTMSHEETKAMRDIIVAEASSEHKITAIWRPLFMLFLMVAMAASVVAGVMGRGDLIAQGWDAIPEPAWTMIQIGVGGYIGGRSLEKIVKGLNIQIGK